MEIEIFMSSIINSDIIPCRNFRLLKMEIEINNKTKPKVVYS